MVGIGFPVALQSREIWLPYATLFSFGTRRIRAGAKYKHKPHTDTRVKTHCMYGYAAIKKITCHFSQQSIENGNDIKTHTLHFYSDGLRKGQAEAVPGHAAVLARVLLLYVVNLQRTVVEDGDTVSDLREARDRSSKVPFSFLFLF